MRLLASRAGIALGTFTLLATSAPPSWTVQTSASADFASGPAGANLHRIAPAALRLEAPKGLWPILVRSGHSHGFTQVSLGVRDSFGTAVDVTWQDVCEGCDVATVEVACRERACSVDIPITLDVRQEPAYPREGSISLTASIGGRAGGGGAACGDQTKENSTDTSSAPEGLNLKLTIGKFEDVREPDGEGRDADTVPPMTMDGGPREGGLVDAPVDASSQDGGALTDAAMDGGEAGVDGGTVDGG